MREMYQDNPWTEKTVKAAIGSYSTDEGQVQNSVVEIFEENGTVGLRADGKVQPFIMVNENVGLVRGFAKDGYVKLFKDGDGNVFAIGYGGRMLRKR